MKDVPAISSNESDRGLIVLPDSPEPAPPLELYAVFMMGGERFAFFTIHFPKNGVDMVINYSIGNFPRKCKTCFFTIHESSNCNNLDDRCYDAKTVSEDPWPSVKIRSDSDGNMDTLLGQGPPITIGGGNGFTINQNHNHAAAIYKTVATKNGGIKDKLLGCIDKVGRVVY